MTNLITEDYDYKEFKLQPKEEFEGEEVILALNDGKHLNCITEKVLLTPKSPTSC